MEESNTPGLGPLFEPAPVVFQFETPGWYVVFGILGLLIFIMTIKAILKYHKNAYRRQALVLLKTIENKFSTEQDVKCINDTMVLLKQVSLTTFNRNEVAELNGKAWLEYLDSKAKHSTFVQLENAVFQALYQNKLEQPQSAQQVFTNARNWIKHHAWKFWNSAPVGLLATSIAAAHLFHFSAFAAEKRSFVFSWIQ